VETSVVVLAIAQSSFGGHFIQRRRWKKYMDLDLGLGKKG
jgi:uncharacterized protein YneF (UPF0154 family)